MRILNVNASLDPTEGGSVERTLRMSVAEAKAGHDVTILVTDKGLSPERAAQARPAKLVALPCLNERFYVPRVSFARLRQLVAEAHVVHLMNHWSALNALVAREARRQRKPYVVCPAGALRLFGRSRWLKQAYNAAVGRELIRGADALIAITDSERAEFADYGAAPERVHVIPNAVDPDDYALVGDAEFRRKFGLGEGPIVLFLGRLNAIKGPDLLLEAFAGAARDLPHLLVFAGIDEGLGGGLLARAEELGLAGRVRCVGRLGREDKSRALHAAGLLAVPSRREAMSIVALEAGMAGTPVLLTEACGFAEIESAGGGLVVPTSVAGLQGGLRRLLSDDVALRGMGQRLHALCLECYTWDRVVGRYDALYAELVRPAAVTPQSSQWV